MSQSPKRRTSRVYVIAASTLLVAGGAYLWLGRGSAVPEAGDSDTALAGISAPESPRGPTLETPAAGSAASLNFRNTTVVQSSVVKLPAPHAEPAPVPLELPKSAAGPKASVSPEPPNSPHPMNTGRELRMKELLDEVAKQTDPHLAQRTKLTIAGFHVGNDDWLEAKKIYDDLAQSPFVEVRTAAARNLQVVSSNLALMAEPDPVRRESMQLDLAELHQSLGHEKFAKKMLRDLQTNATQATIREQAAQRLANYVIPPLPVLPENPNPPTAK